MRNCQICGRAEACQTVYAKWFFQALKPEGGLTRKWCEVITSNFLDYTNRGGKPTLRSALVNGLPVGKVILINLETGMILRCDYSQKQIPAWIADPLLRAAAFASGEIPKAKP